jgi:glycosyltransferase involved in cell wall biosynthesis
MTMKILHISRPDSRAAGVIAYSLHEEMLDRGYFSRLLVMRDDTNGAGVISMRSQTASAVRAFAGKCIRRVVHKNMDMSYCPQGLHEQLMKISAKTVLRRAGHEYDVIILYFLDGYINAKTIAELKRRTGARLFWFLPDAGPLTGGCHYPWQCEGFKQECGSCPAIYSGNPDDITRRNMIFKKTHLAGIGLTVLAASRWLLDKCRSSALFKNAEIAHVNTPVNEMIFCPTDRATARKFFGLPEGPRIVFFGMQNVNEKRKGVSFLLEALNILRMRGWGNEKIHLLIAGADFKEKEVNLPFPYTYVGLLPWRTELPAAFNAADVFVCPSVEDAGPMMINQAVLCGTPVVAFKTGVAPDLVITGETGYCAEWANSYDFAAGIETLLRLSDKGLDVMRKKCRDTGLEKTALKAVADTVIRLIGVKEQLRSKRAYEI